MKYTLLTGSTSDIGNSIALSLSLDYNLLLLGRDKNKLEDLAAKCGNLKIHKSLVIDFSQLDNFRDLFIKFIIEENIEVENIIHCAGIMKVMHLRSVNLLNTHQIFNINLFSILEIISILVNKKYNKESLKNILFISSILARYGSTGHNLYSSSKAALDGLMRAIAVELAPRIRVNSILPGAIKTKMSHDLLSNELILNKLKNEYLLGIGNPIDISSFVKFLISNEASWVTGQEFIIDGGRTINIKNN
jgi:NAD(P)-dependent dehydrogenase (short-subunit alcohol dehydrogenase family)